MPDRRQQPTVRPGGRRALDPITDLAADTRAYLRLTLLATYFDVDRRFLVKCIEAGVLKARLLNGTEYRVKRVDALAFEQSQLHPASDPCTPERPLKHA